MLFDRHSACRFLFKVLLPKKYSSKTTIDQVGYCAYLHSHLYLKCKTFLSFGITQIRCLTDAI